MDLDFYKTELLTYAGVNEATVNLEFRFIAFDPKFESSVRATNQFTLSVSGSPNFCQGASFTSEVAECQRLSLVPCPNEVVYLSKDRLTHTSPQPEQVKQSARQLYLNSLSNWWSYESPGGALVTPLQSVTWSGLGTDGT